MNYKMPVQAFFILGCLAVFSVHAATITVTENVDDDPAVDNGLCSLREAVITANSNTQVDACIREGITVIDQIFFDPATDTDISPAAILIPSASLTRAGANEDAALTGDLDITENLRIVGNYSLAETADQKKMTQIGGEFPPFNDRIFHVQSNVRLELENLFVSGGRDVPIGGGILAAVDSTLILENCNIFVNQVDGSNIIGAGGGIYALGSVQIANSAVLGNIVTTENNVVAFGGGIFAAGELVLDGVYIAQNRLNHDNGDARGANIYYSDLTGGGLTMMGSHLSQGSTLTSGTGSALGLGLYHAQGQAVIAQSTFSLQGVSNMPPVNAFGGAIYSLDPMTLTNTTISNNSLDGTGIADGAGVFVGEADATLNLNNVTIFENSAFNFPDVGLAGGLSNNFGATVNVSNSIIAGNTANTASPDCRGTITSQGYNLLSDDSDCVFTSTTGDQVGSSGAPIDPVLDALTSDPATSIAYPVGDVTLAFVAYHPLLSGSTAIDAGDPQEPTMGGSCETEDARGQTRPEDGDDDGTAVCDIGAFELPRTDCTSFPVTGCMANPLKAKLIINSSKLKFIWSGNGFGASLLGTPLSTTDYTLCLYRDDQLVNPWQATAGDSWKVNGVGNRIKYRNKTNPAGLAKLVGKTDASKAKFSVKTGSGPSLPLDVLTTARVQIVNSNGNCWEASFSGDQILLDDSNKFKAKR